MNFWQNIEKPIIGLSPMDGVTDASFRFITAKYGRPDVTFTEFVNVEAAIYAPHILLRDLAYSEIERPVVAQIYGHTPELFYKVGHIVCELGFDGLDINMGCPAKSVASKGSGAGLIRTPELARAIIQSARRGVDDWSSGQTLESLGFKRDMTELIRNSNWPWNTTAASHARSPIPVSVKTRLGYDAVMVEEWMQSLLAEQPAAIALHGRTLTQQYKGRADWDAIARAVTTAKGSGIVILGNGDLTGMAEVYRRVRETGVDGVLIGRSAQGEPWLFRNKHQVKIALGSTEASAIRVEAVALEERFRVMLEHSEHFHQHTQVQSFVGMRKHLAWYCKGFPGSAALRAQLVRVNDIFDVAERLRDYSASFDYPPRLNAPVVSGTGGSVQTLLDS